MINKVRNFFNENELYGFVQEFGDRVKFYDYLLLINDVSRNENVRLTKTERVLLSYMMNYVYINGDIDGNKKKFDAMIDYLIRNEAVANKKLYLSHKNNLSEKEYVKKIYGKYRLSLSDEIIKILHKESIMVSVFFKNSANG